jgi:hypothetical protein
MEVGAARKTGVAATSGMRTAAAAGEANSKRGHDKGSLIRHWSLSRYRTP